MSRIKKTTATTKKHLTKAEIKNISGQEEKLKLDRNDLVVPGWLQDDLLANNEFVRVVNESAKINLFDNLDLSILAIYSKAYSSYINCTNMIDKTGYMINSRSGKTISPYVAAQNKYAEQIFKCSGKLGLATTDRLKLIVPTKDTSESNKFLKYLG